MAEYLLEDQDKGARIWNARCGIISCFMRHKQIVFYSQCCCSLPTQIAKIAWGQHGAHLGPVGIRWAPCWPHEPCYLGRHSRGMRRKCVTRFNVDTVIEYRHYLAMSFQVWLPQPKNKIEWMISITDGSTNTRCLNIRTKWAIIKFWWNCVRCEIVICQLKYDTAWSSKSSYLFITTKINDVFLMENGWS